MRFNPKARLDTSRTRDVGGGGRGGGMRLPLPGGRAGGGIGGIVLVLIVLFFGSQLGLDPGSVLGGGGSSVGLDSSRFGGATAAGTDRYAQCQTGEDANENADCALVAVENSLYEYWEAGLGDRFRGEQAVITFTGGVDTQGCGSATSDVGPFYCPTDETIYLDTRFFADVLERQLGGEDAPFTRSYVLAHEYGHHIQNVLGYMGRVRTQQGPTSDAVRLELQADCLAGMWAQAAQTVPDADGNVLIEDITDQDIEDAIGAATAVGDDYIQRRSGGRVNPEGWTHGSSEQRVRWFRTGMSAGNDLQVCDTFAAERL